MRFFINILYLCTVCNAFSSTFPLFRPRFPDEEDKVTVAVDTPVSASPRRERTEPAEVILRLRNRTVDEGDTAKLNCSFCGTPEPTVQWYKDSVPIGSTARCTIRGDSGTNSLEIRECMPEDSGLYLCEATNSDGKAQTQAHLTVEGEPFCYCLSCLRIGLFTFMFTFH